MTGPIVPSSYQPISGAGGIVTPVWQRFFNALVGSPSAVEAVSVTSSPMTFKAAKRGFLAVTGGTVTDISFSRARATISVAGGTPFIPMANDDEVTITYSSQPTISFIPM